MFSSFTLRFFALIGDLCGIFRLKVFRVKRNVFVTYVDNTVFRFNAMLFSIYFSNLKY